MTLHLDLDERQLVRLREAAERLNVSPSELAVAAITELLERSDESFESAAARVLEKNAELYRRLAQ